MVQVTVEYPASAFVHTQQIRTMGDSSASSRNSLAEEMGRLRLDYEPLDVDTLKADVQVFEQLRQELDEEWKTESDKYYETIALVPYDGEEKPRRNYANPQGIVEDKSLFPYHDSCYALLDAYDGMYENFDQQPIHPDSKRPSLSSNPENGWIEPPRVLAQSDNMSVGSNDEEGLILCTLQSIMGVLFQKRRKRPNNHDSSVLVANATLTIRRMILRDAPRASVSEAEDKELRPNLPTWPLTWDISDISPTATPLPSDPLKRAELLLKLLKHSLSEWQRDHILAGAILAKLAKDKSFEDIPVLQKTLVIIASEYVCCDNFECQHFVEHDCHAWKFFLSTLTAALRHGIDLVTDAHARTIACFTRYVYLREFGHLLQEGKAKAGQPAIALRRLQLKRSLVANRLEDEELETASGPENQTPTRVLFAIIQAFGRRGEIEHAFIRNNHQSPTLSTDRLAQHLDSYYNSLRVVTSMAMSTCQILPNSERLYQISSLLVRSITACLLGFDGQVMDFSHNYEDSYYLASKFSQLECVVTSPFRLADRVRNATKYASEAPRLSPEQTTYCPVQGASSQEDLTDNVQLAVQKALRGQPHEGIREVVRNLFLRDAVYMIDAGLGYADFCIWGRFPIQPLDPVLSWHDCNHPMPNDLESDEDSDDDESTEDDEEAEWLKPINWAANEDGFVLGGELYSHFSFSLMALFCAFHGEPWNPNNHHSFNTKFRQASKAVVMSLSRYNFPQEIVTNILSFLPRDGWPEDRKFCWNYECALRQMAVIQYESKATMKAKLPAKDTQDDKHDSDYVKASITCKRCGIATYCSKECRSHDWKEIHKRVCIEPPYHGSLKDHALFCQAIADGSYQNLPQTAEEAQTDFDAEDGDESDWESVESDELIGGEDRDNSNEETNTTQAILNYIKQKKDVSLYSS